MSERVPPRRTILGFFTRQESGTVDEASRSNRYSVNKSFSWKARSPRLPHRTSPQETVSWEAVSPAPSPRSLPSPSHTLRALPGAAAQENRVPKHEEADPEEHGGALRACRPTTITVDDVTDLLHGPPERRRATPKE